MNNKFLFFRSLKHETNYWVGKDSLKSWRRMYLELFECFVNNHDIPPNTNLPLDPNLLTPTFYPSNQVEEENGKCFKGKIMKMDQITLESMDGYRNLAHLLVNNSLPIFKILKLTDFKPFHCSLLELESVLEEMTNILSTVIAKKVNDDIVADEEKKIKQEIIDNGSEDNNLHDCLVQTENDSKTDDEHKDDDIEYISQEEKDKHDDSDSMGKNDSECMSWIFNEDITCSHGKSIIINLFK